MTKAIFLGGAALLTLGTAALAQTPGAHKAPSTRAEVTSQVDARFAKMDANKDGVLNQADRAAKQAERFAALDSNKDGALTQDELKAGREMRRDRMKARRADRPEPTAEQKQKWAERRANRSAKQGDRGERGAARFAAMDGDGNGTLSLAEFTAPRAARANGGAGMAQDGGKRRGHHRGGMGMGKMADANGDGAISIDEMRNVALARFDKVDSDSDGIISAAERQAAREAHKARRDTAKQAG